MADPITRRATELPVVSWTDWDNVQLVKSAVKGLEHGVFDQAALVVDAMGRDDRISGCLETRTTTLPSLPLHLEPRGDGRQKRAVAKELDDVFEDMFPDSALSELHQWGVLLGVGIGENVWEYGERRWTPRLKVWHPRYLSWRQETRSFWLQTQEGVREVIPGDGQWVLYTPNGLARGWMRGKVRSLYVPWLMRAWGLRDWARYSEVHGMPIRKVVTPPGAEEEDKKKFLAQVAALGSESTIRTPRVPGAGTGDTDRYDLELVEAMSQNWQTFDKLLDKAEACIAIALLGQNLTTEVKGGSYAATMAHMAIRNDVLQSDSERLAQCIRKQTLAWWALHNFGSAELAPMPKWRTKQKTPEERVAKGTAFKNLGEGLNALRVAGVKVDVDAVVEDEEIPTTGNAEDVAPVVAPAAGAPGAAPPPPAQLPRPRAAAASKLADDVPAAAVEGQLYVDRLGTDGTKQLTEALSRDVRRVLDLIADAPDYAALRERLVDLYGEMTLEQEAELIRRGMLMTELAGRYAARREAGLSVEPREDDT